MKTNRIIILGIVFSALLGLQIPKSMQGQMILEVGGGAGYSIMDVEAWTGYSKNSYSASYGSYSVGGRLDDWSQLMYQGYIQFYPLNFRNRLAIGVEGGYQHYLSYDIKQKIDDHSGLGFTRKHEYDNYSAWRLLIVARGYLVKGLFAEVGGGMYFIRDYIEMGCEASLGYEIKLSETLYLPIKLRTDFVFDSEGNIIAPGATVGLAFRIGGKKNKNR